MKERIESRIFRYSSFSLMRVKFSIAATYDTI